MLLDIRDLNVAYGVTQVLWDINLEIRQGEIVALIGSNGAGKTTLLSTISGLLAPRSGSIHFKERKITAATTQAIVDLGIIHVPEGRRLFPLMTVRDQLLIGAFRRNDRAEIRNDLDHVLSLFPRLKERLTTLSGKLSGGEQQMTAIGRALMARPNLLMVDELSLGLAPVLVEGLMDTMRQINRDGMTILMVEQDVQVALEIADRGYVLESGQITLSGSAASLLDDPRVQEAYLGTSLLKPKAPQPS